MPGSNTEQRDRGPVGATSALLPGAERVDAAAHRAREPLLRAPLLLGLHLDRVRVALSAYNLASRSANPYDSDPGATARLHACEFVRLRFAHPRWLGSYQDPPLFPLCFILAATCRLSAALAAASVGAPPHVLPVARPLAAPDKGATAGGAGLLGQLGLLPGAAHARATHQPRIASRADQARVRAQLVVISD